MRRSVTLPLAVGLLAGGLIVVRPAVPRGAPQGPGELKPIGASPGAMMTAARADALVEALDRGLDYVPGEVLIRFKPGVSAAGQTLALRGVRSRPTRADLEWIGSTALLRDESEPDAAVLARQLMQQPEVLYAEPNYLRYPQSVPSDPSFASRQWNFTSIDMSRAWDIQPSPGNGVIVAVIDTGVTNTTQSLVFPTWNGSAIENAVVPFGVTPEIPADRLLPGFDFAFFVAGQPVVDMVAHGTHVASTIAQEANNNLFGVGMAYRARIMPLKACIGYWELQFIRSSLGTPGFLPLSQTGGCPSSATAAAIRYAADNGAKVINLSLSGPTASQTERDAITYAVGRGVFVAAAMGNHFETGNATHYPAGFAPEIRGLVSVGATGRSTTKSYYSATGSHIEIAAPGGNSRDGGSEGVIWQVTVATPDFDPATIIFPRFNRYIEVGFQGTSMATPHVSALAAMLIAQGVTRPADIETIITRTARDLGPSGKDDEFGYGLIQPRAALFGMGIR